MQSQTGGVAAGDPAEQLLQRTGAAQPLQIAHQGQAAVRLTGPAEPLAIAELHPQVHRLAIVGKAAQLTTAQHRQLEILKGLGQHAFVRQDGWQDGEMGHGPTPAFPDPSEHGGAVQWPLPPEQRLQPQRPLRLGVMASGAGSNFEALVAASRRGELPAEVQLLVVNNPGCGAQERAERLGIATRLHDHRLHASREELDRAITASFREAGVDLVVMAGWMRIVTQELIDAFPDRLLNIHPSLLPSFRGARAIEQALAAGVTLSGCTAHLVSLEVDTGPILVQAAVPVLAGDSTSSLAERIHRMEHRILPLAVQLAAQRLGLLPAQG